MNKIWMFVLAVLACGTVGCAFKMGNADMSLLNGLNQPTIATEKVEKVTPTIKTETR